MSSYRLHAVALGLAATLNLFGQPQARADSDVHVAQLTVPQALDFTTERVVVFKDGFQVSCAEWVDTEKKMVRSFDPVELYHQTIDPTAPAPVAILEPNDEVKYFNDLPEELKELLPEGIEEYPRPAGIRPMVTRT